MLPSRCPYMFILMFLTKRTPNRHEGMQGGGEGGTIFREMISRYR